MEKVYDCILDFSNHISGDNYMSPLSFNWLKKFILTHANLIYQRLFFVQIVVRNCYIFVLFFFPLWDTFLHNHIFDTKGGSTTITKRGKTTHQGSRFISIKKRGCGIWLWENHEEWKKDAFCNRRTVVLVQFLQEKVHEMSEISDWFCVRLFYASNAKGGNMVLGWYHEAFQRWLIAQ